jgi:hypothetical protein
LISVFLSFSRKNGKRGITHVVGPAAPVNAVSKWIPWGNWARGEGKSHREGSKNNSELHLMVLVDIFLFTLTIRGKEFVMVGKP